MVMREMPELIAIWDEPTAGIRDCGDVVYKMKKDLAQGLVEHIAKRNALYYSGCGNNANKKLVTIGANSHCVETISCPSAFIKLHVKKRDRHQVTDEVEKKVMNLLFDRENGFVSPLPPRETQYLAFLNGYYDIHRGKFYNDRFYPGYQRWAVQTNYIKRKQSALQREEIANAVGSPESYQDMLRCIGPLLSGYPVQRSLMWCSHRVADLLQHILTSLLPQDGAMTVLHVNDATPDYQRAAKSDCHAVVVCIANSSELTSTAWKKLLLLAEVHKPTLIKSSFLPFMKYDVDPDGLLKGSLHLVPADIITADFASNLLAKPDWLAVLASDSMRFLYEFINRVEPDVAPDIDEMLARPDPSDICGMTAEFLRAATVETEYDTDVIEQRNDFCVKLAQFVEESGGDPKKVTHQGIGVHLKRLGVKTDEVKLPGRKNKIVCLINRKWKLK